MNKTNNTNNACWVELIYHDENNESKRVIVKRRSNESKRAFIGRAWISLSNFMNGLLR